KEDWSVCRGSIQSSGYLRNQSTFARMLVDEIMKLAGLNRIKIAAAIVMQTISQLLCQNCGNCKKVDTGRAVVCTIHQAICLKPLMSYF
ncbi:hypothetical protein FRX31_031334, partial [Thalictrum thalictroides]